MKLTQAINEIEDIYSSLSLKDQQKYIIQVMESTGKVKKEWRTDASPKIQVYGIERWKSLNQTYENKEEFDRVVDDMKKRYNIKFDIYLSLSDKTVRRGRGRSTNIGKIRLIF